MVISITSVMALSSLVLFAGLVVTASAFSSIREDRFPEIPLDLNADYGTPLFLTPYIEQGQFAEAKNLSRVGPLNGTTRESYTGFLTVNPLYNSNIFFWYFPADNNPATAPVVIWLQGGPGSSSMFGLFGELGPFVIDANLDLHERQYHWATQFNLIFFDNPVGTGFSFTDDDAGYSNTESDVADNLYEALQQILTLWSELQPNEFWATGESYGGKYVPAISYKIMQENPTAALKINLKGAAIGNGWIDPESQFDYGDYLYNVGLIDQNQRALFYEQQIQMVQNIQAGKFIEASNNSDIMVPFYYRTFTHIIDYYNYLREIEPPDQNYYYPYLQKVDVRNSIHVGNLSFGNHSNDVYNHLLNDICQSTKPWLEALLDSDYKILLYNGQNDVICNYYLQMNMIYGLNWKGVSDYRTAKRLIWRVASGDAEVAGYVKNALNFWEIMVRNGGHISPYDQPRAIYDMITRFIFNQPFTN